MERQTCVDCQRQSPATDTKYTLISSQHGWRLARTRKSDGIIAVEWRCPPCWRRFKEAKGSEAPPSSRAPAPSPSPKHDSARSIFARASRRLVGRQSEPPPGDDR